MAPAKKEKEKMEDTAESTHMMRSAAEKELSNCRENSPDLTGQTPEQLIHELRVHQIELETQAEELRRIQHELEKSRYEYFDLYELAPVGYITLNDKGLVIKSNLTAAKLLGVNRNNLLNRGFGIFIAPKHQMTWYKYFQALCRQGEKQVINLTIRLRDGTTFPCRLEGSCIAFNDGSFVIHMTMSNISDIVAAQEELRTSHSRLESAMEVGKFAWWEMECSTGKVSFSEQKAQMLGYPAEKFSHYSDFTTLLHPDDYEPTMQAMRDHLSGVKTNYEADYRIRTITGEYRWFHDTGGISAYGRDGAPAKVSGLVMDITGRKQADLAVRESEERFRLLLQHVPSVAVQGYSIDGTTQYWNEASEKFYGYTSGEAIGKNLVNLIIPPEMREDVRQACLVMAETGQPVPASELSLMRKDGSRVAVFSSHAIIKNSRGEMELFCIDIDLSGRKLAEEKLRFSNTLLSTQAETSIDGILVVDESGKILSFNRRFMEVCGIPEEVIATGIDEEALQAFLANLAEPEEFLSKVRYLYSHRDEKSRDEITLHDGRILDRYTAPMIGSAGEYYGRIWNFRDITAEKQVQNALKDAVDWLKIMQKEAKAGFWDWDLPAGKLTWSEGFFELFGLSPTAEPSFETWLAVLHPDDRTPALGKIDRSVKERTDLWNEYRIILKNGEQCWIGASGRTSYDDTGKALRMSGICIDITDRKRDEELLQKTMQLLNETQEITNLGGWEYEVASGRITWTDEVYRIHGVGHDYDPNNVTNDVGFYVPEDAPVIEQAFKRLIYQGEPYDLEAGLLRGDGRIIRVRTMGKPVMADGRIIRVHGNIIDITDRKRVEDALRESEERYRGLIDGVPDYILVHRKGKILFVNPAAIKVIGRQEADLVGSDMMNYIAPESRALVVEMVMKRAAGEAVPTYEIEIITKGGEKRVTEVHGALIMFQGEPASLNVLSDVTERKQAEEALRESEERFHSMFERHDSVMLLICPETGKIIDANLAAEQFYGRSQKELCTMSIDKINILSPEEVSAEIMKAVREQNNFFTFPHLLASGEIRTVEVHSTPINLGEKIVLFSIINDVTERKRAEEALRESEEKYRALLFGSGIGVGYWSPEGNLLFLNEVSQKRLMAKEEDYTGKNIREIFGDDAEKYFERIRASALSSDPMEYEDYISLPSGKGWYLSVYSCIKGVDGSVKGVQVLSIDITARKMEQEARERLLNDIKQKNAELERFTYTVSHDLKSPLITIKGFLGYLEKDALAGDAARLHEDIARIHAATSKMEDFITSLLELSRVGRIVNPPVCVALGSLVHDAVEALDAQIRERNITLVVPGNLPEIYGDRVRLQQVMTNLIGNAVKFMGDQKEPRIEISADPHEGAVFICIQDNGIGIAPDNLNKIFSVFTRLNPVIPGAGIGLALVKRIVEVHGGVCWVDSPGLGKGSRFCFSLPEKSPDE